MGQGILPLRSPANLLCLLHGVVGGSSSQRQSNPDKSAGSQREYIYLNKGWEGFCAPDQPKHVAEPLDRLLGEQMDQEVDRRDTTLDK